MLHPTLLPDAKVPTSLLPEGHGSSVLVSGRLRAREEAPETINYWEFRVIFGNRFPTSSRFCFYYLSFAST